MLPISTLKPKQHNHRQSGCYFKFQKKRKFRLQCISSSTQKPGNIALTALVIYLALVIPVLLFLLGAIRASSNSDSYVRKSFTEQETAKTGASAFERKPAYRSVLYPADGAPRE
ncbi:hypothetical protein [Kushneria sinocarnis]|uniref:hypothetical protein n=1 Tax=Kushneria sinocarnis TaxID=595502 RepID=UPI0011C3E781|nr:hypothetical protein [Kushneria sinocarnis]